MESSSVPTGILGFDKLLNGGFERDSVNLLEGGAGSGKTIFAMQFIINGILKFNEPGIFITFEERKEKLIKHMAQFGWNIPKLEEEGKLLILEHSPSQVQKLLDEGGGLIEEEVRKLKAKRIVIDSITSFALLSKNELAKRQSCLALFDILSKWDCTAVLISEHEPSETRKREHLTATPLEFGVDSITIFYYPEEKDIRKRYLEILKVRGIKHSKKKVPMTISNSGIIIKS